MDGLLLMLSGFAGTCSSAQTEAISQLHPETSLSCHLGFTSDAIDFAANDVFKIHTSFDTSIGKVHFQFEELGARKNRKYPFYSNCRHRIEDTFVFDKHLHTVNSGL